MDKLTGITELNKSVYLLLGIEYGKFQDIFASVSNVTQTATSAKYVWHAYSGCTSPEFFSLYDSLFCSK
jgi:hypothetical protein